MTKVTVLTWLLSICVIIIVAMLSDDNDIVTVFRSVLFTALSIVGLQSLIGRLLG